MKVSRLPARPPARRQAENECYDARVRTAGLVQLSIVVPVRQSPVLKALAVEWRAEARALLETDLPTSDQVLQTNAIRLTLNFSAGGRFPHARRSGELAFGQRPELGGAKPHASSLGR
jgi:hypothetical protein